MTKAEAVAWAIDVTWWCAVGWYKLDLEMYEFFRLWCEDIGTEV